MSNLVFLPTELILLLISAADPHTGDMKWRGNQADVRGYSSDITVDG